MFNIWRFHVEWRNTPQQLLYGINPSGFGWLFRMATDSNSTYLPLYHLKFPHEKDWQCWSFKVGVFVWKCGESGFSSHLIPTGCVRFTKNTSWKWSGIWKSGKPSKVEMFMFMLASIHVLGGSFQFNVSRILRLIEIGWCHILINCSRISE